MALTEKGLKHLTKGQLLHIMVDVIGTAKLARTWQQNREAQAMLRGEYLNATARPVCRECEAIDKKLAPKS